MAVATERRRREYTDGDAKAATIEFDVVQAADEQQALSAVPFTRGASPPKDRDLICSSRSPSREGMDYWIVTCAFTVPEGTPPAGGSNPIERKTELRWGFEHISEAVDRDVMGNPLLNSAWDPISGVTNDF